MSLNSEVDEEEEEIKNSGVQDNKDELSFKTPTKGTATPFFGKSDKQEEIKVEEIEPSDFLEYKLTKEHQILSDIAFYRARFKENLYKSSDDPDLIESK